MSLRKIPDSDKPIWRQFFQNARGRGDLKQPAGFLTLFTLWLVAYRGTTISDALVFTLGTIVILWWVGDTTEAVAVLMALYGKWSRPENLNVQTGANPTNTQAPIDPDKQEA